MKKLKILYAEDEPDVQTIVEISVWSMSEHEIKTCPNGKLLLECVEDYKPDLILLDIMMPEMDGPTTHKNLQLNEKTKDIPVIFITAKAQVHEIQELRGTGVVGIITKPFDPVSLCGDLYNMWENSTKSQATTD